MINKVVLILSAIATAQCQYPALPYSRPCGISAVQSAPALPSILPAGPPCVNTLPVSFPIPNIPPSCGNPLPLSLLNSPYELSLAIASKNPLLPTPIELPFQLATPPKCLKSPYELALPITLPKSYSGLETTLPKLDIPLPRNPFLPAASPVSALAPFSPSLPPANTCSRCQYLKKIPIPPPCI